MTSLIVPNGYDEAHAAGWTYHRNGISGCDFYAKVEDGALHIAWCVWTEEAKGTSPVATSIPLPVLAGIAQMPATGETLTELSYTNRYEFVMRHVVEVADGRPTIHAFDIVETYLKNGAIELAGRILVVSDIEGDDDEADTSRVAAFMLAEVLDGNASSTLRGDTLHADAIKVAGHLVAA